MTDAPSIERLFAIYVETQLGKKVDPVTEDAQRRAFYCGFESALRAVDILAEISHSDTLEGENAWLNLLAEFEKFATEQDCGSKSINH